MKNYIELEGKFDRYTKLLPHKLDFALNLDAEYNVIISANGELAKRMFSTVKSMDTLNIIGHVAPRHYNNKKGEPRTFIEFIADEINII